MSTLISLCRSLFFICLICFCYAEAYAQWRILPLGNSITQAQTPRNSYRRDLWHLFQNASINVDFVGSFSQPEDCGAYPDASFDHDHEGHWGYFVRQILNEPANPLNCRSGTAGEGLASWLQGYTPDMVLMHLGTNNMIYNNTISSTIDEIEDVIQVLRNDNPHVVIFLAQLIPSRRANDNIKIDSLNDALPNMAAALNSSHSPIFIVDQNTGYDPMTDNYDNFHPNTLGEAKIAQNWFNAVNAYINTPFPVEWGEIMAVSSSQGVRLRWDTHSESNLSHFEIEHKPISDEGGRFIKIATQRAVNSSLGAKYEYLLPSLSPGQHLLRLKQVDYDGKFTYSRLIQVEVEGQGLITFTYRQEGERILVQDKVLARHERFFYTITSVLGQEIYRGECTWNARGISFPIQGLPRGMYVAKLQTANSTLGVLRFMVRS